MNKVYVRPLPSTIFRDPVHLLAFGFGSGLAPKAPGTFGTLAAVPLYLGLMWLPLPAYLMVVAALFGAGVWLCGESAHRLGTHDHPGIVFDEFVGFLITMAPVTPYALGGMTPAPQWFWIVVGFAVFRVFDIAKPAFIRRADSGVHGGFGIMLDDALAGLCGAAALALMAAPSAIFATP